MRNVVGKLAGDTTINLRYKTANTVSLIPNGLVRQESYSGKLTH